MCCGKVPVMSQITHILQITKCAVEKSQADAKVRRSTCSAGSAITQYSTNSSSANQALLDPYSSPGSGAQTPRASNSSQMGTINRNYNVSPHIDRQVLKIWYKYKSQCTKYDIPRNESLRDNINAAKTLVIILIIFFVCWFPFFLTYILSFVGKVRI